MGGNLARQAIERGHEVVGYSADDRLTRGLADEGLQRAASLRQLVADLVRPRIVLVYVPHGAATEQVCAELRELLDPEDLVADGGNSHWEDSRRHHAEFAQRRIAFLDVGTSGGIPGAREGACFMVGGDQDAYARLAPLLRDLAFDDRAVVLAGPPGAGHFAKLAHNAIEFGMVQAIAEGVELLTRSEFEFDLPALFDNWEHGSVIRSWLVELMHHALSENPELRDLATYVEDTGEVKWVLEWALERDIPSPAISESQQALMGYRDLDRPMAKTVALLRHAFGGHPVHRVGEQVVRT